MTDCVGKFCNQFQIVWHIAVGFWQFTAGMIVQTI